MTALIEPDDHPEPPECDHDWKWISDWYGDPDVINGTADCSRWECQKCDATKEAGPHDHDDDTWEYER